MFGSLSLLQPATVAEASSAMRDFGERAKIYAGGAELLLLMHHGLLRTEVLVDVKNIERLRGIKSDGAGVRVGACVTHHALESHPAVREHLPLLAYAESQVANIRVRNQGTLGGNLCFNDPHSDPPTVLLIYEASIAVGSGRGERHLSLEDFLLDSYSTGLDADELLVEIQIPPLPAGMKSAYLRVHRFQRPTLGVGAAAIATNGLIEEPRLAIGCVGRKAERLRDIESQIAGATITEAKKIIREQREYLRRLLRPVDDLLGSAEYKLHMSTVLLGNALESAIGEETKNGRR
jgi:aerobic carbon-monoxide dehydrogenase medium subunit